MHSERTPNKSSRTELLKNITNSVANDDVYVPTDDELFTLGLDTRHGRKEAKYIVSGSHAGGSASWSVYEIEAPDFVRTSRIQLRYETWRAPDRPGRAITGIGRLEMSGVGVNKSVLRKELKEIWTPHNEDAISDEEPSDEDSSQLDKIVSEINEEQEGVIPRNDAHLREDIRQAIKAAAKSAMDSMSHIETEGPNEYQVEYRLDPTPML
ncbi:MAG: hypothetical protein ABEI52_04480 [Halobacteriaceae archaeon]